MALRKYTFKSEVWLYPGLGGWHFVNVPEVISKGIRKDKGKGMVKVSVTVGKTAWNTALFPYKNPKGDFGYLISIKKVVRNIEGVSQGDMIKVSFNIV